MTYRTVPDGTGMSCTVIARSRTHSYRIVTTYIADPARDAVLMRVRFDGPRSDQLYVRLDPLAGGTGGGGTQNAGGNSAELANDGGATVPLAFNTNTTTNASNRDYAVPTFEALRASAGFASASVGYAGTPSDGLSMLDTDRALTPYTSAPDGHVALTARLRLPRSGSVNLALGFGTERERALAVAGAATRASFASSAARYARQWRAYDRGLRRPVRLSPAARIQYFRSVNVVKASEDKTFLGAIAAGLASPWGQSVPAGNFTGSKPTYFGSYREVFARDLYEAFTGLLVAGDLRTAQAATRFLFERQQQPDGSMPRNSLTNGKPAPDTGGLQLDETSYPILMAWQSGLARDAALYAITSCPPPTSSSPTVRRRSRALGGAERLLPLNDCRRDRRLDRRGADRGRPCRSRSGSRLPGHGRLLCPQHQALDRDHDRSLLPQLLHPRRQDRRPQRCHLLQPRQRQHRR
jgi:glucoamylase